MNAVREWANAHDYKVGQRGRIAHEVFIEYLIANPQVARQFLNGKGIEVGKRGRIKKALIVNAVIEK